MAFLHAGGRRFEYAWHGPAPGAAPTLVFLHGGLGCVDAWRDFPERLAAETGYGALVYSRSGHGRSDPDSRPHTVRFMHDEALSTLPAVLDAKQVERAVLVGTSDGGSIALIHAGSRVSRACAVIAEAAHVFVEPETLARAREIRDEYATTDLAQRMKRRHGANARDAFYRWNDVWLDPQFRSWNIVEYLPRIRVPVMAVQGDADPYGTMAQVDAISRNVGGPCMVARLAGCGHMPHRERPEPLLSGMALFLRQSLPRTTG